MVVAKIPIVPPGGGTITTMPPPVAGGGGGGTTTPTLDMMPVNNAGHVRSSSTVNDNVVAEKLELDTVTP